VKIRKSKKQDTDSGCSVQNDGADDEQEDSGSDASDGSSVSSLLAFKQVKEPTIPSGHFNYLKNHPLYGTHKVKCVPENKSLVPNFIGETLPCRDRGD
jgi:hypothetical protein